MKTCLKVIGTTVIAAAITIAAPISLPSVLVVRVAGTTPSGQSQITYVDEYSTNGTLIQTFQMPNVNTGTCLTISGSATSEGKLSFSPNCQWVALVGYDIPNGTANANSTANRTIARIKVSDGSVDVSTTGQLGGNDNARCVAVSDDGTKFWAVLHGGAAGTRGVRYIPFGSTTTGTQLINPNTRGCAIFGGQLYAWGDATGMQGVYEVGTGLPETSGQSTYGLPGISGSSLSTYGFFMADLSTSEPGYDTLWMAREAVGVTKYSKISGTWTANNTNDPGTVYHISGAVNADNSVSLYIIESARLMTLRDTSGYNANMSGSFVELAAPPTGQAFRGVAASMIPEPSAIVLGGLMLLGVLRRRELLAH